MPRVARLSPRTSRTASAVPWSVVLALVAGLFSIGASGQPTTAQDTRQDVYYVTPGGSGPTVPECAGGTEEQPWGNLKRAFACLTAGDTLWVRGGRYEERVLTPINRGYASARIRVRAYPGERPIVIGLIRLENADWWELDGINVTSDPWVYKPGEYLVKMRGGVGWTYRNAEIWNARSYAAFRVESSDKGPLDRWRVSGNCIHTTQRSHGPNEDHNIYVDTGWGAGQGTIDRNLIFDAPNGTNIKLGPGADPESASVHVVVKYNTLWNGVQNILANGRSNHLRIERNILGHVIRKKSWYPHVRGFDLDGGDNVVLNNVFTGGTRPIVNDQHSSGGWRDRGGNRAYVDPKFSSVRSCDGFRPGTVRAYTYGRWAPPKPRPRPVDVACPRGGFPPAGFGDVPTDLSHRRTIDCMAWRDVAHGVTLNRFYPDRPVTRGQMATFLARLITRSGGEFPVLQLDAFTDDDGHPHEHNINRLAAAGLIDGVGQREFRPDEPVARAQMATMLVRAYEYRSESTLASGPDYFGDDSGIPHQTNINAATLAGFASGVEEARFGPWRPVTRAQMATFVARVYDLILDL